MMIAIHDHHLTRTLTQKHIEHEASRLRGKPAFLAWNDLLQGKINKPSRSEYVLP